MSVRTAVVWSMTAQYAVFVIQFVTSVLITRLFLSPDELGVFSLALSAALILSTLQDFGLTRYLIQERELTSQKIAACFTVFLIAAAILSSLLVAGSRAAGAFYDDARVTDLLRIVALSYFVTPFNVVSIALLQRQMRFKALVIVNVGAALGSSAVGLALAAAGYSAYSLAWATVVLQLLRCGLSQLFQRESYRLELSLQNLRPVLRFGGGMSLLSLTGTATARLPELAIGKMITIAAVGLYGRASSLTEQLRTLLSGAVVSALYPAFVAKRDAGETLNEPYLRVVANFTGLIWPAMTMLALLSQPLVTMLYGERWIGVAPLLAWIAMGQLFYVALPLHMEIPTMLQRIPTLLRVNIVDAVIWTALLLTGASMGLREAVIAQFLHGLVWYGLYAAFLRGLIQFRWGAMLRIYFKATILTAAVAAPAAAQMLLSKGEASFVGLLPAVAAGAVLWLAALPLTRHPLWEELAPLRARLQR